MRRIRRPHGIPFYSPAETYEKRDLISSGPTSIRFTTRGIITDATPHTVGRLRGSASLHFMPQGSGSSEFTRDESESYKIKGTTTMHFFQKGELTAYHKMRAVAWIVFNLKMLIHKLTGETSMTFDATATLRSYKLRGIANIVFSVSGEMNKNVVKYGLLYNWYAATDAREITSAGWHVPSKTEWETLVAYLGGISVAGGKLKETGLTYWKDPNLSTNEVNFNARGHGTRSINGVFQNIKSSGYIYNSSGFKIGGTQYGYIITIVNNITSVTTSSGVFAFNGLALRIIKDSTTLSDGETGTYTGNDGKIYRTICIGTQEWVADNLAETKYRNGDSIPKITDNAEWVAASGGAMCAYNNDWSNVFI